MKKTIITISREFGSGGREIGKKLAEQLNVPFYDKELIEIAAKESGLDKELFEEEDSRTSKGFRLLGALGYSLGGPLSTITELSLNDRLFLVQSQVIEQVAKEGACVIVGRCADYVLKDYPNVVSVFVHADRKFCLDRSMERHSMTEKEMQKYIEKTDQYRGDFYRYHTGHEWVDARNYDLCLNSGKLGFEKCVEEIKAYIKVRFGETL